MGTIAKVIKLDLLSPLSVLIVIITPEFAKCFVWANLALSSELNFVTRFKDLEDPFVLEFALFVVVNLKFMQFMAELVRFVKVKISFRSFFYI